MSATADLQVPDRAHPLPHPRLNAGTPLDLARVRAARVNQPAVARRVAGLNGSRGVKKVHQAAWLVKAIQCMDLTTLAGDDTPARVRRLCAKARRPLRDDLLAALGLPALKVGAVCVYHEMVAEAVQALQGSGIPVAVVSTGFPAGQTPMETKLREIELSVAAGAQEVDIVISRRHALTGDWPALFDEIAAYRAACGSAHLKTILATGELQTLENVARASWVAMAMEPVWRKPVACPVSCSREAYKLVVYCARRVRLYVARNWPTNPAACQVVPQVSCLRSRSTTSVHPRNVR